MNDSVYLSKFSSLDVNTTRVHVEWMGEIYTILSVDDKHIRLTTTDLSPRLRKSLKPLDPNNRINRAGCVISSASTEDSFSAFDIQYRITCHKDVLADPFAWKEYVTNWTVTPGRLYTPYMNPTTPANQLSKHKVKHLVLSEP